MIVPHSQLLTPENLSLLCYLLRKSQKNISQIYNFNSLVLKLKLIASYIVKKEKELLISTDFNNKFKTLNLII